MARDYIEVWRADTGASLVVLEGTRISIGRSPENEIALDDPAVSRLHAALERYPSGWSIRDLGSTGGTKVNGNRLLAEYRLIAGDEIRLGSVRLIFRTDAPQRIDATIDSEEDAPRMTPRERDVLVALCRPLMTSQSFAQPATIKEMANALVVSTGAIKFHLSNLFDKFGIPETGHSRRSQLANEAVRRGAVTMSELQSKRLPN
jgi:pSer/pThr/pTyr-binding forkhead associated (FHA) protein